MSNLDDIGELYQQVILDHNRQPHNFGELPGASHSARGDNPLCGDQLKVDLEVDADGVVQNVRFSGQGCAISKASASLMTDSIKGKSRSEIEALFEAFHTLVAGSDAEAAAVQGIGKLQVFAGVREYPMRVKCATLAWHTVRSALAGGESASTE